MRFFQARDQLLWFLIFFSKLQVLTLEHHVLLQEELLQKKEKKSKRLEKCHKVCCIRSQCIMCLLLRCDREAVSVKKRKRKREVMHSDVMLVLQLADMSATRHREVRRAVVCSETWTGPSGSVTESQGARRLLRFSSLEEALMPVHTSE